MDCFRNLVAVPSYHYDPAFAVWVNRAWETAPPSVVALELPAGVEPEMDWAMRCWPTPVCSMRGERSFPWVAGDSMLEAFRCARRDGVPVVCVDADVEDVFESRVTVPGPECVHRAGALLLDLVSEMAPPGSGSLAREAHMARALAGLMKEHARVLWVGGMAHWRRIRGRLERGDLGNAEVQSTIDGFERGRLGARAVLASTGRFPWLVRDYARHGGSYDEAEAVRQLLAQAAGATSRCQLRFEGGADDDLPESLMPGDLARVALYARNLAMAAHMGDRPDLHSLLRAAHDVVGPQYAGRVFALAMRTRLTEAAREVPRLDVIPKLWSPPEGAGRATTYVRKGTVDLHAGLPAGRSNTSRAHCTLDSDDARYARYVRRVMMYANQHAHSSEGTSHPFVCGFEGGIDLRATLVTDDVHVLAPSKSRPPIRNAVIDYTNETEMSATFQGLDLEAGWADPSLRDVGSLSLNLRNPECAANPTVLRMFREWSFVTLDMPTSAPDENDLYHHVILPLLDLFEEGNRVLHASLKVIFRRFARRPIAWFSRYVPGPSIHEVARRYRIEIVHVPLARIPEALRARHGSYDSWYVTRRQWEVVSARDAKRNRR